MVLGRKRLLHALSCPDPIFDRYRQVPSPIRGGLDYGHSSEGTFRLEAPGRSSPWSRPAQARLIRPFFDPAEEGPMGRVEDATALRDAGHLEEAIREFRLIAEETADRNCRAALLLNEARCHASLGHVDDADRVLREIAGVAPDDLDVRLQVSFATACVSAQEGKHDKAALQFGSTLAEYAQLLDADQEFREDICLRRAIELVVSDRNSEAVPFLEEALSFRTLSIGDQQLASFHLALTYEKLQEGDLAMREFQRTISFNLLNWNEAEARYRAACSCFARGAYAKAKHILEKALDEYSKYRGADVSVSLKNVYGLLSRACQCLGEKSNERHYANLSKNCT